MMLGQSQHSSDSQQSAGSHSQGSNAMKQHNSTRLSETYFYLCILPLLQRMHSSIFSIDPFISDNRNWVFCANKSNRVYSLWFCVCSILARVSIQLSEFENCEWEYCEEWRNGCSSWLTLNWGLASECCECDMPSENIYCILQVNNNRVSSDSEEGSNLVTRLVLDKNFLFILRHKDTVILMGSIPE